MERRKPMATKAHLDGNKRYLEKQDEIRIRIPKGEKAILQAHAAKREESLNKFIVTAISQRIEREETTA
jgi:uncharacterized protein (DUF1778 family)